MAAQIDFDAIIESCTQEEIVDLLKRKMIKDTEAFIENLKKQVAIATGAFQQTILGETAPVVEKKSSSQSSTTEAEAEKPKRRGRPAKKGSKSSKKESGGAGKQNLGDLIKNAVGKEPIKIDQILEKVTAAGWSTKSNNPRMLINQELSRLVKKGSIAKAERGSYKRA